MKTTKNLILAAAAVLSLGAGPVMAQGLTQSGGEADYYIQQHQAAPRILNGWAGPVQSGSSDVGTTRTGVGHVLPFRGNFGTLANPG